MGSDDFTWVAQAIAIHREVGGNLAEVLDAVGHTIRERNAIRRQVKALSAEGKLSAIVLMALPFGVTGFISLTNPGYIAKFTESLTGYAMLGVGRGDAAGRRPVAQEDRGDQVLMSHRARSPSSSAALGRRPRRPGAGLGAARPARRRDRPGPRQPAPRDRAGRSGRRRGAHRSRRCSPGSPAG